MLSQTLSSFSFPKNQNTELKNSQKSFCRGERDPQHQTGSCTPAPAPPPAPCSARPPAPHVPPLPPPPLCFFPCLLLEYLSFVFTTLSLCFFLLSSFSFGIFLSLFLCPGYLLFSVLYLRFSVLRLLSLFPFLCPSAFKPFSFSLSSSSLSLSSLYTCHSFSFSSILLPLLSSGLSGGGTIKRGLARHFGMPNPFC